MILIMLRLRTNKMTKKRRYLFYTYEELYVICNSETLLIGLKIIN